MEPINSAHGQFSVLRSCVERNWGGNVEISKSWKGIERSVAIAMHDSYHGRLYVIERTPSSFASSRMFRFPERAGISPSST